MTGIDTSRTWLPLRAANDIDAIPMFCLPHAGGAASAFRTWLGAVPGARVLPVQLPGREGRMREEPYRHTEPLVQDVAALITEIAGDRPYVLYGHSLGALTAFETARELRRRGAAAPSHLIVSGSPAPQKCHEHGRKVSSMPTPKLVRMLRKLGGTPDWLLDDPELQQMILPAVRSDFAMREAYRYQSEAPLDVPITVLASDADPRAPHRTQTKWSAQTVAAFTVHTLPGGHFAIFEQPELTRGYLTGALTSCGCP